MTPFPHPPTPRGDTVETRHGQQVADPYRWLEDPDSPETTTWVAAQNAASRAHLAALSSRPWFETTMRRLVVRPRAGTPDRLGSRYVVTRNDGTQEQDLLFVGESLEELAAGGRLLIDPNLLSEDGTSSLADWSHSKDGRWLAYLVSDGGSDWTTIRLLELDSGREIDDVQTLVKFSTATWLPDGSYLYLHYPVEGTGVGTEAAALPGGRLRRHRVGEAQDDDDLVLEFPDEPRLGITPELSHDGRWLVVSIHEGTSEKTRLWVYPVSTDHAASILGEPLKVVDEAYAGFELVRTDGSWVYLVTDHDAPLRRVVKLDLAATIVDGGSPDLVDVVPESDALLEHVEAVGDELLAIHLVDAAPRLTRVGLDGSALGTVPVEGGAVTAVHGEVGRHEVFLGLSSVTSALTTYRLDLGDGSVTTVDLAPVGEEIWKPPAVRTSRLRATSMDQTAVPYFLIRRADLPDGPRPTLLWGYGGFAIPVLASYRPAFAGWLSAGGVLAVANLRGGGEFGTAWHDGGRLANKQNVFDDFAAVAEHLVQEGVTTPGQLALHGASNGGLLVGATIVQRPDLAAVALPMVGVLDMLRFHLFTIGAAWIPDYGSPEDPEMFEVLRAYSPLHNVVDQTSYPATLVLTGDHDDRVVPAHSFKFVAAMQHAQEGSAPVLARIETSAGHGTGKPLSVVVQESADLLAFAAEHTGLTPM